MVRGSVWMRACAFGLMVALWATPSGLPASRTTEAIIRSVRWKLERHFLQKQTSFCLWGRKLNSTMSFSNDFLTDAWRFFLKWSIKHVTFFFLVKCCCKLYMELRALFLHVDAKSVPKKSKKLHEWKQLEGNVRSYPEKNSWLIQRSTLGC